MTECYIVELSSDCMNSNTGETECLSAPFMFRSEAHFEMASDCMFDELIEPFNDWLQTHGKVGWHVDDVIEPNRDLATAIDLVVVTHY